MIYPYRVCCYPHFSRERRWTLVQYFCWQRNTDPYYYQCYQHPSHPSALKIYQQIVRVQFHVRLHYHQLHLIPHIVSPHYCYFHCEHCLEIGPHRYYCYWNQFHREMLPPQIVPLAASNVHRISFVQSVPLYPIDSVVNVVDSTLPVAPLHQRPCTPIAQVGQYPSQSDPDKNRYS